MSGRESEEFDDTHVPRVTQDNNGGGHNGPFVNQVCIQTPHALLVGRKLSGEQMLWYLCTSIFSTANRSRANRSCESQEGGRDVEELEQRISFVMLGGVPRDESGVV